MKRIYEDEDKKTVYGIRTEPLIPNTLQSAPYKQPEIDEEKYTKQYGILVSMIGSMALPFPLFIDEIRGLADTYLSSDFDEDIFTTNKVVKVYNKFYKAWGYTFRNRFVHALHMYIRYWSEVEYNAKHDTLFKELLSSGFYDPEASFFIYEFRVLPLLREIAELKDQTEIINAIDRFNISKGRHIKNFVNHYATQYIDQKKVKRIITSFEPVIEKISTDSKAVAAIQKIIYNFKIRLPKVYLQLLEVEEEKYKKTYQKLLYSAEYWDGRLNLLRRFVDENPKLKRERGDNLDVDKITDELELGALIGIINKAVYDSSAPYSMTEERQKIYRLIFDCIGTTAAKGTTRSPILGGKAAEPNRHPPGKKIIGVVNLHKEGSAKLEDLIQLPYTFSDSEEAYVYCVPNDKLVAKSKPVATTQSNEFGVDDLKKLTANLPAVKTKEQEDQEEIEKAVVELKHKFSNELSRYSQTASEEELSDMAKSTLGIKTPSSTSVDPESETELETAPEPSNTRSDTPSTLRTHTRPGIIRLSRSSSDSDTPSTLRTHTRVPGTDVTVSRKKPTGPINLIPTDDEQLKLSDIQAPRTFSANTKTPVQTKPQAPIEEPPKTTKKAELKKPTQEEIVKNKRILMRLLEVGYQHWKFYDAWVSREKVTNKSGDIITLSLPAPTKQINLLNAHIETKEKSDDPRRAQSIGRAKVSIERLELLNDFPDFEAAIKGGASYNDILVVVNKIASNPTYQEDIKTIQKLISSIKPRQ